MSHIFIKLIGTTKHTLQSLVHVIFFFFAWKKYNEKWVLILNIYTFLA